MFKNTEENDFRVRLIYRRRIRLDHDKHAERGRLRGENEFRSPITQQYDPRRRVSTAI